LALFGESKTHKTEHHKEARQTLQRYGTKPSVGGVCIRSSYVNVNIGIYSF